MAQAQPHQLRYEELTRSQKAALLIISLDINTTSAILKSFTRAEIERISIEIARLDGVQTKITDAVMNEFQQLIAGQEYSIQKEKRPTQGFIDASEVMERIEQFTHLRGFRILNGLDPHQLARFLQKEHPQTISVILANLNPEIVSMALTVLPEDLRKDVAYRMATLGKVSPALVAEIQEVLESIAVSEFSWNDIPMGGAKSVATILNRLPTATSRQVMEHLESVEPNLAEEIKQLMFLFEDIQLVDDRGIQRILREVDKRDLAIALKVTDKELKKKIFGNMSDRAQELLKEELVYTGPVRQREIEAAQMRIVEIVKQLVETGEVVIARRFGTEEIVD